MNKKYDNTTVGVPVFERVESTRYCLQNAYDYGFRKVIVADDGKINDEKKEMYRRYHRKTDDFTVIDIEYDIGVSAKRNRIVEEVDTDYLLLMDSDNSVVNVEHAYKILDENGNIGGVSGLIVEPDRIRLVNPNLNESPKGNIIIRNSMDVEYDKESECYICDFIPQCGLFRMEIFDNHRWDENFKVGYEHLDFFLSFKDTKWKFASSPSVAFEHEMKCDSTSTWDKEGDRLEDAKDYFLSKWGYEDTFVIRSAIVDSRNEGGNYLMEKLYERFPLKIVKLVGNVKGKIIYFYETYI